MCTSGTFILISVCCSLFPSTISGHLGGFQFQVVINYAASNFAEHVFLHTCSCLCQVFTRLRVNAGVQLYEIVPKVFQSGCVNLGQQEHMVFYWSPFSPTLGTSHLSPFSRQWTWLKSSNHEKLHLNLKEGPTEVQREPGLCVVGRSWLRLLPRITSCMEWVPHPSPPRLNMYVGKRGCA